MKKHFGKIFCGLVIAFMMVACNQNNVDPRDAFEGSYDFNVTGEVELFVGANKLTTVPLDEEGTFLITKAAEDDEVLIIGYNDTIHATVAGKYLLIDPITTSTDYNGVTIQLTFLFGKATLEGTQLSCQTDVQANASYSIYTATGNGQLSIVATKK